MIVNKVVGNRYIEKRVNIRIEHIRHSKCRQEFLDRVKRNHDAHVAAREKGGESCSLFQSQHVFMLQLCLPERVTLKRIPAQPRPAHTVSTQGNAPQTMAPVPYETTI